MAQRVSRAKATLQNAGARFEAPRSEGTQLVDASLADEATRLTRQLTGRWPTTMRSPEPWP